MLRAYDTQAQSSGACAPGQVFTSPPSTAHNLGLPSTGPRCTALAGRMRSPRRRYRYSQRIFQLHLSGLNLTFLSHFTRSSQKDICLARSAAMLITEKWRHVIVHGIGTGTALRAAASASEWAGGDREAWEDGGGAFST